MALNELIGQVLCEPQQIALQKTVESNQ